MEMSRNPRHADVFNKALDKLEPAAAQATWWNLEKVLYKHLGGRVKRA
jgi:hypothetical protein